MSPVAVPPDNGRLESMGSTPRAAILLGLLSFFLPVLCIARDVEVRGDYLEARTADVYTGPCFANSEMNLAGKDAILAWRVGQGGLQGVSLAGLSVVAVVRASATLGDPHASARPVRSVILVDENANARQRVALAALARSMAADLLGGNVTVEAAPIRAEFDGAPGVASVAAGNVVEVKTRALCSHDHVCGNEEVYYPPLIEVTDAVPAYALANVFHGPGLGGTWSSPRKRSAFVAKFAR